MEAYHNLPPFTKAVVWAMATFGIVGLINYLGLLTWQGLMFFCATFILGILIVCAIANIEEGTRAKIFGAFQELYNWGNNFFLSKIDELKEEIAKEKTPA